MSKEHSKSVHIGHFGSNKDWLIDPETGLTVSLNVYADAGQSYDLFISEVKIWLGNGWELNPNALPRDYRPFPEDMPISPRNTPQEGESHKIIIGLKSEKKVSSKGNEYGIYIPYVADQNGDPKAQGRVVTFGQQGEQIRQLIPDDLRPKPGDPLVVFPEQYHITGYYTLTSPNEENKRFTEWKRFVKENE